MRPRQSPHAADQGGTFIVLGDDGRHVLLGRAVEPDAAEVATIGAKLAEAGRGGWVVLMRGDYWRRSRRVRLALIQEAAPSPTPFDQAEAAFQARRKGTLAP